MKKLTRSTRVVLCALAMVLASHAPSLARGAGGHSGFGGGHPGGGVVHHGYHHHGHVRHFHPVPHGRFRFAPVVPFYGYYPYAPPAYSYGTRGVWYYCPSYGAYYPDVTSCPEAWVLVPSA